MFAVASYTLITRFNILSNKRVLFVIFSYYPVIESGGPGIEWNTSQSGLW